MTEPFIKPYNPEQPIKGVGFFKKPAEAMLAILGGHTKIAFSPVTDLNNHHATVTAFAEQQKFSTQSYATGGKLIQLPYSFFHTHSGDISHVFRSDSTVGTVFTSPEGSAIITRELRACPELSAHADAIERIILAYNIQLLLTPPGNSATFSSPDIWHSTAYERTRIGNRPTGLKLTDLSIYSASFSL